MLCPECYIDKHSSHRRITLKKAFEEEKVKLLDQFNKINGIEEEKEIIVKPDA